MIGCLAVAFHRLAELLAPVEKRAKSYATMGATDRRAATEEREEVFEPWYSSGPAEWLAPPPHAPHLTEVASPDGVDGSATTAQEVPGASPLIAESSDRAPESSVGVVQPAPADVVPSPSSPPDQAADSGPASVLEDFAIALCEELLRVSIRPSDLAKFCSLVGVSSLSESIDVGEGFWEHGADDEIRETFRTYAWALLGRFNITRK